MRKERGFTLIELLIVVAIIGIIAAIAIPNLLNAINRGRQKRTMADMRTIGTAIEEYAVDMNFYPNVGGGRVTILKQYLEPTYIRAIPEADGWSSYIQVDAAYDSYTLISYGLGGASDGGSYTPGTTTQDFHRDIVFSNGQFVQWPDRVQN